MYLHLLYRFILKADTLRREQSTASGLSITQSENQSYIQQLEGLLQYACVDVCVYVEPSSRLTLNLIMRDYSY